MVDLRKHGDTVAMHRSGDFPIPRNDVAMKAVNELLVRPVGGMGAVFLGDDQANATGSTRPVVRGVLLGRLTVSGVVGEMRREHQSIACRDRTQLQRCP